MADYCFWPFFNIFKQVVVCCTVGRIAGAHKGIFVEPPAILVLYIYRTQCIATFLES